MTDTIYENPYERLFLYAKKLCRCENTITTICEISTTFEIPLSIVREDICFFVSNGYLDFCSQEDTDFSESEQAQLKILHGDYDNIPIDFDVDFEDNPMFLLPLTRGESIALNNLTKDSEQPLQDNRFIIKHPVNQASPDILSKVQELYSIIKDDYNVILDYDSKKEGLLRLTVHPLKLAYDSVDYVYYLIAAKDPSVTISDSSIIPLRVSRIRNITPTTSPVPYDPEDAERFFAHKSQVFGMNFHCEPENIQKVKVRFYNEANVWNKVRKELASRIQDSTSPDTKLYEENGYLYFEDTIYGISSFRSWLLGYGSSAIVEEPVSLRNEMYRIYCDLKDRMSVQTPPPCDDQPG